MFVIRAFTHLLYKVYRKYIFPFFLYHMYLYNVWDSFVFAYRTNKKKLIIAKKNRHCFAFDCLCVYSIYYTYICIRVHWWWKLKINTHKRARAHGGSPIHIERASGFRILLCILRKRQKWIERLNGGDGEQLRITHWNNGSVLIIIIYVAYEYYDDYIFLYFHYQYTHYYFISEGINLICLYMLIYGSVSLATNSILSTAKTSSTIYTCQKSLLSNDNNEFELFWNNSVSI